MAGNRVVLTFIGDDSQLSRVLRRLEGNSSKLEGAIGKVGKSYATLGAVGGAVQGVAALGTSLAQMAGSALLLPAIIGSAGAAFATLKLATAGMGKALEGDGKALKKLQAPARDFVTEIRAMKPELDSLRAVLQSNLFTGVAGQVKDLGSVYFPILKEGLGGIAYGFNQVGRNALGAFRQADSIKAVTAVLHATRDVLVDNQKALGSFIHGFLVLGGAGAKYIANVGGGLARLASQFEDWSMRITRDGSFEKWVSNAGRAFRDFFGLIGNLGSILTTVLKGLTVPSQGLFTSLRETTGQLDAFLRSAAGQDALKTLGEVLRTAAEVTRTVLLTALRELAPIIKELGPVVTEVGKAYGEILVSALRIVGPLLQSVAHFLNEHKEVIRPLTDLILILYGRFLLLKGIANVVIAIRAVTAAVGGLSGVIRLFPLVALGAIAIELDKMNMAAAEGDSSKLDTMADSLHNLVGAGEQLLSGDFSGISADIQSEMGKVGDSFRNGTSPIGAFYATVSQNVSSFVATTSDSFSQIGQFFSDLPGQIGGVADSMGASLSSAGDQISGWFSGLVSDAGAFLSGLGSTIATGAADAWSGLVTGAGNAVNAVELFLIDLPNKIAYGLGYLAGVVYVGALNAWHFLVDTLPQVIQGVGAWLSGLPGRVTAWLSGLATATGTSASNAWGQFLTWTTTKINEAGAWISALPGRVGGWLSGLAAIVGGAASRAWTSFTTWTSTKINEASSWVSSLPGKIGAWLSSLPGIVGGAASRAWESFRSTTVSAGSSALAWIRGVPGQVMGAFAGAGSWLVSAGRNIIQGLWNGLKSIAGGVLSWIQNIGHEIAAGFAAAVGIHSPSTVFAEHGINIGKGLIVGMKDVGPNVIQSAVDLGDRMAATANAGSQVAPGGSLTTPSNSGPMAVELNFGGNVDSALASALMKMYRTGDLQFSVVR